jgi:L-tartrate/succinate antiporter
MTDFSPTVAMIVLVTVYFFSHYLFASITAHVTAMLPVMLAVGGAIAGMPVQQLAMMLVLCNGIMFVLTPYAGGPNPVYYGSGYLPAKYFWPLGAVFGMIFFATWLGIGTLYLASD